MTATRILAGGAFPGSPGHYVLEKKTLKLEEAIRKMTSLRHFAWESQIGVVRPNKFADLVVFDPNTIIDKATFKDPHQYPEGIRYVFVNGTGVMLDGEYHNQRAGQILRKSSHSKSFVFPQEEWKRWESPEKAGWSAAGLKQARDFSKKLKTAALMIVQGGRIVDEWGETWRPFNCHSMRKSILSALYGPHVLAGTINTAKPIGELGIEQQASPGGKNATVGDL